MEKEQKIEKLEKEPKISYHILYGPHVTSKDFEKLEEAFKKADVYIPEKLGYITDTLEYYNKLSQGELNPKEMAKEFGIDSGSHTLKQYQVIYNSKKPILFVDVPDVNQELMEECERNDDLNTESFKLFTQGMYDSAIEKMRKCVINDANFELKREELIKKNLKGRIAELIEDNPQLEKKDKIRALLTLGALHTRIYHDLKKEGLSAFWEFARLPFSMDSTAEAIRRGMFSKGKKPNEILLARGIVEPFLYNYYLDQKITDDTSKVLMISRKIASKLNLKDIKKISERIGENPRENIFQMLYSQGIKIPKSEKEMDEMLKI